MDVSLLLTLTQTLIQLLESSTVRETESVWNFQSQLAKIKDTMSTIAAVLRDAEEQDRQQVQRSHVERDWIEKLKDAVYEADDLFDEVATVGQLKKLMAGNKISKDLRLFFSRFNQLFFAYTTSREINQIRGKLECIAKDNRDFASRPIVSAGSGGRTLRRDESHSLVQVENVIGRYEDKEKVIGMLLDSRVQEDVDFVTLVGIGGIGKTTLAQLVYNDERIKRDFPLMLWVCVSDDFDIKSLLCKILKSGTNQQYEILEMDQLCCLVRAKIKEKKYLLVLDDVWCEDRDQWLKLKEMLIGGEKGNKIMVTTRSKVVARIVGTSSDRTYELEGLSREDSWQLFERMAFENEELQTNADLIEIGKSIVNKCANVPLAIRVIGTLFYGQSKNMWLSFRNMDLANIKQGDKNNVMAILKLSYHHLAPPLKSCFCYCAIFPKDYTLKKEILISLWMAQGFIQPLEGKSVEDAGEEYFMTLLQRCFFHAVERDVYDDEIVSCRMHDLMHDVAREVSGTDMLVAKSQFNEKTRHFAMDGVEAERIVTSMPKSQKIRTFFSEKNHGHLSQSIRKILLSKMKRLRVLDLHGSGIKSLPSAIDKLLHLRYLDLSDNDMMELLPTTLTMLINLQTLKLEGCERLRELPEDFGKLANLRQLDIYGCNGLTHMPPGMNNLTCLHRLTMFVVGDTSYGSDSKKCRVSQLEDLEALANLRGSLEIKVRRKSTMYVPEVKEAKYIRGMEHLKRIDISFEWWHGAASSEAYNNDDNGAAELLVNLEPHPNLRSFRLERYQGVSFPSWAVTKDLGTSLPNLVELCLSECRRLKHLPSLNNLRCLKTLKLFKLDDLEYVQSSSSDGGNAASSVSTYQSAFFPSLETLRLWGLPKLKGWRRPSSGVVDVSCGLGHQFTLCPPHSFPRLSDLKIRGCPNLVSIPLCSNLEKLILLSCSNENASLSLLFLSCYQSHPHEQTVELFYDTVESLSILHQFWSRLSSLRALRISSWPNLKTLSGGLEHLTALQELQLCYLDSFEEAEGDNNNPWRSLHNLHRLQLWGLSKLVNLPHGMQYLTALQTLDIYECHSLEALPQWISCLTSLQSLKIRLCNGLKSLPETLRELTSLRQFEIEDCCGLTERCQELAGEDWHKIQHFP